MKDLSIFFKHDDVARIIEHVKSVLEASVGYCYPNHPEVEFEKDFNIQYDVNKILNKYGHTEMGLYKIQLYVENILGSIQNKKPVDMGNAYHMITKQDIQVAASYIFRSSFVSEDQARKAMVKAGNNATKILVKTFRGKLFKKAFERARRGKDISFFERQEKESGFNFLHNPNNGRMQSGHIIIDGIGLFKQIIHER